MRNLIGKSDTIGAISLGCSRNTVDSEKILADVVARGARICSVQNASSIFVNTCAFTKDAKEESIDVIMDLVDLKKKGKIKKIFVHGCLSERYPEELRRNFKEVDAFVGIADFKKTFDGRAERLTAKHLAYLKIAEGCDNACSYCVIPQIKGALRSRCVSSILREAESLDASGVKELNIIGQDITLFGWDKVPGKERDPRSCAPLVGLLKKILKNTSIPWIRLFYLHPLRMSDELIELIATEERICPYVDLPLQHVSARILKLMGRGMGKEEISCLTQRLRKKIPDMALRTTFIVGFPSESDSEFKELLNFITTHPFDRLGAFMYSQEEGTRAYRLKGQVDEKTKQERYNALMSLQQKISEGLLKNELGRIRQVLVDEDKKSANGVTIARTRRDAPEVDGVAYLSSKKILKIGTLVSCRITDSYEYDLAAEAL